MHFMVSFAIVIIQMQQKVLCLIHLMYQEVLGIPVSSLIRSAQIGLITYIVLLKIQSVRRVVREHTHQLIMSGDVSPVQVGCLHVYFSLVVSFIQKFLFKDIFLSYELA